MRCFCILAFLLLVQYVSANEKTFLNSNNERGIVKVVNGRRCIAGQFKVLEYNQEKNYIKAKMLNCFASSALHPNKVSIDEVRIVDQKILGNFIVGKTYCMILTYGSMLGMTVVAYGEDLPQVVKEVKKVIQSDEAYQNSKEWQKRRKLWSEFKKHRPSKKEIFAYCENESLTAIFYYDARYYFHQFSMSTKKEKTYYPQSGARRPGRITFEDGKFTGWYEGEVVIGVWEVK